MAKKAKKAERDFYVRNALPFPDIERYRRLRFFLSYVVAASVVAWIIAVLRRLQHIGGES